MRAPYARCERTPLPVSNWGGRSIKKVLLVTYLLSLILALSDPSYYFLTLLPKAYTGIRQPWCYLTDFEPYVAKSVAVRSRIADAKRWQVPSYAHMFSLILLRDQWYQDQVIDDQWRTTANARNLKDTLFTSIYDFMCYSIWWAGAWHSTSVILLWLILSTRRIVVSCSYDDRWATDIAFDVSDGSMAILVPFTPSTVETVNGGVTDLHPTVVTSVWTELNWA